VSTTNTSDLFKLVTTLIRVIIHTKIFATNALPNFEYQTLSKDDIGSAIGLELERRRYQEDL